MCTIIVTMNTSETTNGKLTVENFSLLIKNMDHFLEALIIFA